MSIAPVSSNALAADAKSLNALKLQAGQATPASIKEAAKQFESLFMRELIKSMRDATQKSGMLDGPQGDLGADLLTGGAGTAKGASGRSGAPAGVGGTGAAPAMGLIQAVLATSSCACPGPRCPGAR